MLNLLRNLNYGIGGAGSKNKGFLKDVNRNSDYIIKSVWKHKFPVVAPYVAPKIWGEIRREYVELLSDSEFSQFVNENDAAVRKFLFYEELYRDDKIMPLMHGLVMQASYNAKPCIDFDKVHPTVIMYAYCAGLSVP